MKLTSEELIELAKIYSYNSENKYDSKAATYYTDGYLACREREVIPLEDENYSQYRKYRHDRENKENAQREKHIQYELSKRLQSEIDSLKAQLEINVTWPEGFWSTKCNCSVCNCRFRQVYCPSVERYLREREK